LAIAVQDGGVERGERLREDYQAFARRDLSEYEIVSLLLRGIRAAERWRSVKLTEFERRQLAAIRKELDQPIPP